MRKPTTLSNSINSSTYIAEYRITADTDEPTRDAVAAIDCPQTLEDVRETCKTLGLDATLRDAPGFVRGHVKSDGAYALS